MGKKNRLYTYTDPIKICDLEAGDWGYMLSWDKSRSRSGCGTSKEENSQNKCLIYTCFPCHAMQKSLSDVKKKSSLIILIASSWHSLFIQIIL